MSYLVGAQQHGNESIWKKARKVSKSNAVDETAPEDHASYPKRWKRIFWQKYNGCVRRMNT